MPMRDGLAQQGPLIGALVPDRRPRAQRDDLDLDEAAQALAHLDQRLRPTSARRPA